MGVFIRNFRHWWQPPRNIRDRPEHRQVTFLELFYDLVYVVLIAELTHALAAHVDLAHIANFVFLFAVVWWAWSNGTLYHEFHGNNDIRTRVFTFMQMFCVAAMAVFAHDALGDTYVGFALALAAFQLILSYLWWRTGVHDPHHRPLSRPYVLTYLIATVLIVLSTFIVAPLRYYLLGLAVLSSIILPFLTLGIGRADPDIQAQIQLSSKPSASLVERFGLFTIIVLGEVIVGVVQGVAENEQLTWQVGLIGGLGMLVAIGLWWLFFDAVSHRPPRVGRNWVLAWMYTHLPVTAGIAIVGAAILNVVEGAGEPSISGIVRWMLVFAIALVLLSIAALMQMVVTDQEHHQAYRASQLVMVVAGVMIAALGFTPLQTIPLLAVITVLMLAPVLFAVVFWLREFDPAE